MLRKKITIQGDEARFNQPSSLRGSFVKLFFQLKFQRLILVATIIFTVSNCISAFAARMEERDYFSSLRSVKTNVRAGPGQNYPIKFTFKMRGVPVKVTGEYDNWNEITDYDGETGWIDKNLLTKKRTVIVKTEEDKIRLHKAPNVKSKTIFYLENDVVADFIECQELWCSVKIEGKKGWLRRQEIWGVDEKD